jgi:hypothetical protein
VFSRTILDFEDTFKGTLDVAHFMKEREPSIEMCIRAARSMIEYHLSPAPSPQDVFLDLETIAYGLMKIVTLLSKKEGIPFATLHKRFAAITTIMGELITDAGIKIPYEPNQMFNFGMLGGSHPLLVDEDFGYRENVVKIAIGHLEESYTILGWLGKERERTRQYIAWINDQLPEWKKREIETKKDTLKGLADSLFAEMKQMRRYGVKDCFFDDGILQPDGDAWLFLGPDQNLLLEKMMIFARINLVKQSSLDPAKPYVDRQMRQSTTGIPVTMDVYTFDDVARCDILVNGELGHSFAETSPLRDIFAGSDLEGVYESLRVAHLMRLWDLIVPVEVVRKEAQIRHRNEFPTIAGQLDAVIAEFPELIVPRIRYIERRSAHTDIEKEIEEDRKETISRLPKKQQKKFYLPWWWRRLPPGKNAGKKARAKAIECGVPLPENAIQR